MGPLHLEAGFGLYEGDNINGFFYAFEIVYDLPPSNTLITYRHIIKQYGYGLLKALKHSVSEIPHLGMRR